MRFSLCFVVSISTLALLMVEVNSSAAQGFGRARATAIGRASATARASTSGLGDSPSYPEYPQEGYGNNNAQQSSMTRSSVSRSVSFTENGRKISVSENEQGISVSVNGRAVRAANSAQLQRKNPEAYRLYEKHLGSESGRSRASGRAMAGGGGSARAIGSNPNLPGGVEANASLSRSVSVSENGRNVSIAEDNGGITVTIDGRVIRAANETELRRKNAEAHRLYKEHLGAPDVNERDHPSANDLLRNELMNLRDENGDHPQLKGMIERMLREIDHQ